jgi:hypothetical protein
MANEIWLAAEAIEATGMETGTTQPFALYRLSLVVVLNLDTQIDRRRQPTQRRGH